MKKFAIVGLAAALAMSLNADLLAHGGQYRGPGDTVPPNLGGGGDTTPPGNPGGPGTPGPGAPTTGGGRGPTTGGGPVGPAGGVPGGGRATTGGFAGAKRGGGEGFERWEFWWEHNKEPFLDLKNRLSSNTATSGSGAFLIGRGKNRAGVSSNRPSATDVRDTILPAVVPLLGESHADVVDSSVLAIARMLRADDAGEALQQITDTLGHSQTSARQSACLSLGVLGSSSPEAINTLRGLLNNTVDGRRLTGRPQEVEDMVRAFAAASLGMIGSPDTIEDLKAVVTDNRINSRDLKAMSILSLGLMAQNHEEIVPFLKGLMTDRGMDRIVRAQAPIALGKLKELNGGSPTAYNALSDVVGLFQNDKTDNDMLRSLAVCIGMLAEIEDTDAIDALMNAVAKSTDDQTRHFSIMALAQIGGRDVEPQAHAETHQKLENFFLGELIKPKKITHVPYGGLGLCVYCTNPNLDDAVVRRSAEKVLEVFGENNNPSYKGAMAVGLGLLNFEAATDDLWEEFTDSNHQPLKGYIALSLGMMRANKGEDFRSLIQTKGLEFKFRLQLSRALGLMGDAEAVPTLVSYLQDAETLSETSSSAQALGLIGDRSALSPLIDIVADQKKQPLTRGFACVALGIIAEKTDLPWNYRFSVNSNYRAKVPALSEILDIL